MWRWEIEVNFREEKSILGCGQAQVRTEKSIEKMPAFSVVVCAFLQLPAHKANKNPQKEHLPRSKWYPKKTITRRMTTGDIINEFKSQIWAESTNIKFTHFVKLHSDMRSRKNKINPTVSAVFYARN